MNDIDKFIEDERIFTVVENNKIIVLLHYSVTNDPEKYLNNLDGHYIPHDPSGRILVIENMVATRFGFHLIPDIKKFFYEKYPNLEKTMWRRRNYPNDLIMTLRRRHAKQHSS